MRNSTIDRLPESMTALGLGSAKDHSSEFCVIADLLIPGRGKPIENACVIVKESKIKFVGRSKDVAAHFSHLPTTHVKVLMPGMWDCHVHLIGNLAITSTAFTEGSSKQALTGARCARDCMLLLNAGFTSVREMAGYGLQLKEAIDEGSLAGPSIYSANSVISPTGGHADIHTLHRPWFDDACAHGMPLALADGVPECLRVVRTQLRAGANIIKICASGGVGSELDNPIDQQFSEEELKVMVEEAARARRWVGAHCHGKPGIMAALKAGVMTIEHGSYIDEECADLMVEKGAILIATRTVIEIGLKLGRGVLTPRGYEKMLVTAEAHWKALQIAIKKGVTLATGCDIPGSIPGSSVYSYGLNGQELHWLCKAGLTPLQAIESATANGPLTLGPQAPVTGQLKEGFDADFIGVFENPLEDVKVLADADNVSHVWKLGKLYKGPGKPVSSF